MSQTACRSIRFRSHSFDALALEPEAPLSAWIERLDDYLAHAPNFFGRKSLVIDVSNLGLDQAEAVGLVKDLTQRGIRILGLTGADDAWSGDELPPLLARARAAAKAKAGDASEAGGPANELTANEQAAFKEIANALANDESASETESNEPSRPASATPLLIHAPVRSGQTIYYPEGDVTVVGSIASGADVIAGGSIHIYGALRGRAFAGAEGEPHARIFCRRLEAELLAVGGVYLTADQIETNVRGQPVQAWLEHESIRIARLD